MMTSEPLIKRINYPQKLGVFGSFFLMEHLSLFKLPFEELIFTWQTKEVSVKSRCYLRIYWLSFNRAVVIVSDLSDNLGLPIIYGGKELINLLCSHFKLTLGKIMWLEYFPTQNSQKLDLYYGVQLFSNKIIRYQLTKEYVERLLSTH